MKDPALDRLEESVAALDHSPHAWWIDDGIQRIGPSSAAQRILQRAEELRREQVIDGRRLLVTAGPGADFFLEMCAIWLSGAIFCPVEPGLGDSALLEIRQLLDSAPAATATATATEMRERTVLLTSGSTGRRKGVRLTLLAMLDNAAASVRRLGMTADDHLMINIPFHFTSAICHFLACLVSGARMTAIGHPLLAKDLVERVRLVSPTGFGGAPLQARWLADGLPHDAGLRWLMTSGDDLPVSCRKALAENLPSVRLHVFYGLTEVAGRLTSLHPDDRPLQEGSVGRAIDGLEVEIVGDTGDVAPANQLGEVHARGSMLMLGYVGQPGPTGVQHGFATGDIGWKDDAGFLYLAGRKDDVFKVSGSKVSGLAVREALLGTGMLADAFVFPVRMRTGLIVCGALIVPLVEATFTLAALRGAARRSLETQELPREYIQAGGIPRTGSGKADRRAIDALLTDLGWQREHGAGAYFRTEPDSPSS